MSFGLGTLLLRAVVVFFPLPLVVAAGLIEPSKELRRVSDRRRGREIESRRFAARG